MTISVLRIARSDVDDLHAMAGEFLAFLRAICDPDSAEQQLTGERLLADAFGDDAPVHGYIARRAGEALGYLLYTRDYNSDLAVRLFHVCDLFVRDRARGLGVGRALMDRAAEDCRAWGGKRLQWEVWKLNQRAFDFYRRIGGRSVDDLVLMYLDL